MSETTPLEAFMREHAAREAVHAELFARVAPEAIGAQDALFHTLVKESEARRKPWEELESLSIALLPNTENAKLVDRRIEHYERWLDKQRVTSHTPVLRETSRIAQAMTLQPVRDTAIGGTLILSEDRKLDIIGARYPNFWMSHSGNAYPKDQTIWAEPGDGTFGFYHEVHGTVTGRQANSGAGIYVQFVPGITPGVAQIRPYLPYSYQWSNLSFRSREDTSATLGIRVWSWDLQGGGFATEQDYSYNIWNNTIITQHPVSTENPGWYTGIAPPTDPGWDDDFAFLYGKEAPYFQTRPNRVYMAAIWCFGICYSVSLENRPGWSTGKLHAKLPWVVIGYQ
jgi:hypothetical protein